MRARPGPALPERSGAAGSGHPRGLARPRPAQTEPAAATRGERRQPTMSLPAGMPESRGAPHSFAPLPRPAQGSLSAGAAALPPPPLRPDELQRGRPCPWPWPCPPGALPAISLLGLALLQVGLGCALVALSAVVWLSRAGQMNACSTCAGSLAMLCRILGLTTWKTTVMILVSMD
ncbi:uncharacterized protein LOC135406844 [Pseudopipra pipra]|uniref:uncharacterized protein LOC135406844 n=1 Tax=Pseudopipra pipra TaxID=415032 RepID=UPI0031398195